MSVRSRSLLASAAVAVLAALSVASPAAATAPPVSTTTDPAAAAAGWLAQQFVDSAGKPSAAGDHFDFPGGTYYWGGLTASAIFALAATKTGGDKIQAALSYMASNVAGDANLGTGMQPGPYDGSVATAALAAMVAGSDPTAFGGQNLLQSLKDDICTGASAPANNQDFSTPTCPAAGAARNIFSSVSESLVVLAQARGAAQNGSSYAPTPAAITYFLSLQCPDGGFTVGTAGGAGCTSDVDATGYAAAALVALGGHAAELTAAKGWLLGQRNPAGYWSAQGGPDVDSTGLAASALDAVGVDTSTSRTWLASQQVIDGATLGAGATRGALKYQGSFNAASSSKATADGLLGMVHGASLATLSAAGATPGTSVLALSAGSTSASSVTAGGSITVTGTGFAAGEQVAGELHSTPVPLGNVAANSAGTAVFTFAVPASIGAGSHSVVMTGASGLTSTVTFTVTAAAPVTTASSAPQSGTCSAQALACTGRDSRITLTQGFTGLTLILVGAGAVYAGRRRRA
jgi:hypothetical protein